MPNISFTNHRCSSSDTITQQKHVSKLLTCVPNTLQTFRTVQIGMKKNATDLSLSSAAFDASSNLEDASCRRVSVWSKSSSNRRILLVNAWTSPSAWSKENVRVTLHFRNWKKNIPCGRRTHCAKDETENVDVSRDGLYELTVYTNFLIMSKWALFLTSEIKNGYIFYA